MARLLLDLRWTSSDAQHHAHGEVLVPLRPEGRGDPSANGGHAVATPDQRRDHRRLLAAPLEQRQQRRTCFGDSGGPNFVGSSNILAGVPSFGLNSTCAVAGGLYRVDKADDLNWLATFPVTPCFSASMTRSPGESRGLRLSWPCRRSSRSRDSSQSSADLAGQLDTMS